MSDELEQELFALLVLDWRDEWVYYNDQTIIRNVEHALSLLEKRHHLKGDS